jgi:EAL domain-containing protein (putative c-di-GMP-specific phosphodiesterase class I)
VNDMARLTERRVASFAQALACSGFRCVDPGARHASSGPCRPAGIRSFPAPHATGHCKPKRPDVRVEPGRTMPPDLTAQFFPIYDVGTGRLHGFEARARGPNGEHFRELFASAKQQANDLAELDRRCLRTALVGASSLNADYRLFVNVFPSSIAESRILSVLDDVSLRPEQIVFQIVPFQAIQDYPRLLAALIPIVQLGCMIALDGFGTGYSSLAILKHVPVHYVKSATAYLHPDDPLDNHLLRAMADMARSLRKRFVVPGCDSEHHLSTALACGAELVQGLYVGKSSGTPQCARYSAVCPFIAIYIEARHRLGRDSSAFHSHACKAPRSPHHNALKQTVGTSVSSTAKKVYAFDRGSHPLLSFSC